METTIMGYIRLYKGYVGIMGKKMETTGFILGSCILCSSHSLLSLGIC